MIPGYALVSLMPWLLVPAHFPFLNQGSCDHPFAQPRMLCTGHLQEAKASEVWKEVSCLLEYQPELWHQSGRWGFSGNPDSSSQQDEGSCVLFLVFLKQS